MKRSLSKSRTNVSNVKVILTKMIIVERDIDRDGDDYCRKIMFVL